MDAKNIRDMNGGIQREQRKLKSHSANNYCTLLMSREGVGTGREVYEATIISKA